METVLQQVVAVLLVLGAAGYLVRGAWRSVRTARSGGSDGCSGGNGCGCGH